MTTVTSLLYFGGILAAALCPPAKAEKEASVSKGCPPLAPTSENVVLNSFNLTGPPFPPGSVVRYKCKQHFTLIGTSFDSGSSSSGGGGEEGDHELTCGSDGQWVGISRFSTFFCVEQCGHRKINPRPLVIGGIKTNRTSWPWHVSIFRQVGGRLRNGTRVSTWTYICGGSIVRNSIVLTAAHCVTTDRGEGLPESHFKVALGAETSDWRLTLEDPTVQVLGVKKLYYIYESYDPKKDFQADIAILHLDPGMRFGDYVGPICLPRDTVLEVDALRPGRSGQVAGFGVDENGQVSKVLKYGELMFKSRAECFHSIHTKLSDTQFCAGTLDTAGNGKWTSVCSGDSGGGYVLPAPTHEQYFVYGLVSFANPGAGGSRDDSPASKCENNAVFTRVLPFMDWIRTVLEAIQGTVLRELAPNAEVPYFQSGPGGVAGHKFKMTVWPRELDSRLTSITLNNLQLNAEELVNVLGRTSILHTLNLTDVKIAGSPFKQRVRLPHLRHFVLDLAQDNWGDFKYYDQYYSLTAYNEWPASTKLLEYLLFFNKEYDEELRGLGAVERVASLGTDIDITFNVVKLVNIHHGDGRIMLNSLPQTNSILGHAPPEKVFKLRRLHLQHCKVNLSLITGRLAPEGGTSALESLVLYAITGLPGEETLAGVVQRSPRLKELVVGVENHWSVWNETNQGSALNLSDLPRGLEHLALTTSSLTAPPQPRPRPQLSGTTAAMGALAGVAAAAELESMLQDERIPAKDENQEKEGAKLEFLNLTTFQCINCQMDGKLWENLPAHFPNLDTLLLRFISYGDHILKSPLEAYLSEFPRLTKFVCSELRWTDPDNPYTITTIMERERGEGGVWRNLSNSELLAEQLFYYGNKLNYFSRTFADLKNKRRHSSHETQAIETGAYNFEGEAIDNSFLSEKWVPIPPFVQSYLRVVRVRDVEMTALRLGESLRGAAGLETLDLSNVYLIGAFTNPPKLPLLKSARLGWRIVESPAISSDTFNEEQLKMMIPFQMEHLGNGSGLQNFSLANWGNVLLDWSQEGGHLIMSKLLIADQILNGSRPAPLQMLVICSSPVSMEKVPETVRFLYLNNVAMEFTAAASHRLAALKALAHLRIFEPQKRGNSQGGDSFPINLSDLNTETLEGIALSGAYHLTADAGVGEAEGANLPVFTRVHTLSLLGGTMDERVGRFLWKIFPNITKLLLTPGGDPPKYEELLLGALKHDKLKLIVATRKREWYEEGGAANLNMSAAMHQELLANLPEALVGGVGWLRAPFTLGREPPDGAWFSVSGPIAVATSQVGGHHSLKYWRLPHEDKRRVECELD